MWCRKQLMLLCSMFGVVFHWDLYSQITGWNLYQVVILAFWSVLEDSLTVRYGFHHFKHLQLICTISYLWRVNDTISYPWQSAIHDNQLSVTISYPWQSAVCDNQLSVTISHLWQSAVCDNQLSVTISCLWQSAVCDNQLSVTISYLWQSAICEE